MRASRWPGSSTWSAPAGSARTPPCSTPTWAASPLSTPTAPCSADKSGALTGSLLVRDPECHGLADPFHGRGPRADPGQADPRTAGRDRQGDVPAALPAATPRAVPAMAQPGEGQAHAADGRADGL